MNKGSAISFSNNLNNSNILNKSNDNLIFHSIDIDMLNENVFQLIEDYIELISQGSFYVINNQFSEALAVYQDTLSIAQKLKDEFKINESKCNLGIVYFYLGNLNEAIELIQPCYNDIYYKCTSNIGKNNMKNLQLLCKCGANLCMCLLTIYSYNDSCISILNDIINIISKEKNIYHQILCIEYINNILFRVSSLEINNYKKESNNDLYGSFNYGNSEDEYNEVSQFLVHSLNNFIVTNKFEPWIKSLNWLFKKMEQIHDDSGIIFVLFNQQMAIFMKNEEKVGNNSNRSNIVNINELNEAKVRLTALLKAVSEGFNNNNINQVIPLINEEFVNNVIKDYKFKLFIIRKIYQLMYSFEEQTKSRIIERNKYGINTYFGGQNNLDNNQTENKLIFLFKKTINYFEENIQDSNLKSQLINNVQKTLDLIHSKKIDVSKIDIGALDEEINRYLFNNSNNINNSKKFDNEDNNNNNYIYNDNNIDNKIYQSIENGNNNNNNINNDNIIYNNIDNDNNKNFKNNDSYNNINNKNNFNYSNKFNNEVDDGKLQKFFKSKFKYIYNGDTIEKLNYNNKDLKEHFYQIDKEKDYFQAFTSNNKNPDKNYKFNNIIQICYGVKTENINNKLKTLKSKKKYIPYLLMSLVLKDRTIDLVFNDDESAKSWFYGLYHYLKTTNRKYKIGSCTGYILFRIKGKLIKKLGKKYGKINDLHLSSLLNQYLNN